VPRKAFKKASEPAVYSGVGLLCPPSFACGFARRGPGSVSSQILAEPGHFRRFVAGRM